jgi:dTDP-4-dehydrorhamnose reductase
LSHLADFVRACLELKQNDAPFGLYNIVNPGAVTHEQVTERITQILRPSRTVKFWTREEAACRSASASSNCILDSTKLRKAGIKLRPVTEALAHSLERWQPKIQAPSLADNILPFVPDSEIGASVERSGALPPAQG